MSIWVAHDFVSMILIEESENTNVEIGKEATAQHSTISHVMRTSYIAISDGCEIRNVGFR